MKNPTPLTTSFDPVRNWRNPSSWRGALLLIPLVLACLALSPQARAVCQEGCLDGNSTVLGEEALSSLTTGFNNTAVGYNALLNNTDGDLNTAIGGEALLNNTGGNNTAVGAAALVDNTTGDLNTAIGALALAGNTDGDANTAIGYLALFNNTTGGSNTAIGGLALFSNTTGGSNTATGTSALANNSIGASNTATGFDALTNNRTGVANTATGVDALASNVSGASNTANGVLTLTRNTTGGFNTAYGFNALAFNTTGSSNIALGNAAGAAHTTGSNNIAIGNPGLAAESSRIRIGTRGTHTNTYIAGIYGVAVPRGVGVIIDPSGHLGTVVSSARFKEAIRPMDEASEAIHSLKPVIFRYKPDLDSDGIPQFGLVAEEVAKVNPDLVARGDDGKPYTVRYEAVNAMLLNEFLKEHKKVEEQQATIAELKSTVAQQEKRFQSRLAKQQKQIEALTAGLQKVSAQVETIGAAPQMVLNNQ